MQKQSKQIKLISVLLYRIFIWKNTKTRYIHYNWLYTPNMQIWFQFKICKHLIKRRRHHYKTFIGQWGLPNKHVITIYFYILFLFLQKKNQLRIKYFDVQWWRERVSSLLCKCCSITTNFIHILILFMIMAIFRAIRKIYTTNYQTSSKKEYIN